MRYNFDVWIRPNMKLNLNLGKNNTCSNFSQCHLNLTSMVDHTCNMSTIFVLSETYIRSSAPKVFLYKSVLEICSKFTWEHPCLSLISIKLQSNFIEIRLRHRSSPVNLLHISKHLFLRIPLEGCFSYFLSFIVLNNDSLQRFKLARTDKSGNKREVMWIYLLQRIFSCYFCLS